MAITPITDAQVSAVNVQSVSGDTLTGTVQENKAVFDRYPDLIKEKLNALINEYNNGGTTIQNSVVTIGTAPEGYNPLATNTLRMLFHYQNGNNENFDGRISSVETGLTTKANSADLYLDAATIAAFDWEIGGSDDSGGVVIK